MLRLPFQNLHIWVKAMELAEALHTATDAFPKKEIYGITSQMRDAAVSIPSNIAEGSQRGTDKDFNHFILIAKGSLAELTTQILLSVRFQYMDKRLADTLLTQCEELNKMLFAFHVKLLAAR